MNMLAYLRWNKLWLYALTLVIIGGIWVYSYLHKEEFYWCVSSYDQEICLSNVTGVVEISWSNRASKLDGFHHRRILVTWDSKMFPSYIHYDQAKLSGGLYEWRVQFAHWFLMIIFVAIWLIYILWRLFLTRSNTNQKKHNPSKIN